MGWQEASHENEQPGEQRTSYVMTGGTGSYLYMAPEVRKDERYGEKVCMNGGCARAQLVAVAAVDPSARR